MVNDFKRLRIAMLGLLFSSPFGVLIGQNVGIGSSTPQARLHIVGANEILRLQGDNGYFTFFSDNGEYKAFAGTHGEDFFLGARSSLGNLDMYAGGQLTMKLTPFGNDIIYGANPELRLHNTGTGTTTSLRMSGNNGTLNAYRPNSINLVPGNLILQTGSTSINGTLYAGNVGIGTATPGAKLHIEQNDEALRLSGVSPFLTLFNGTAYKGYLWQRGDNDIELGTSYLNPTGNLFLSRLGNPKIAITADGKVEIYGDNGVGLTIKANKQVIAGAADNTQVSSIYSLVASDRFMIKSTIFGLPQDDWSFGANASGGFLSISKNGTLKATINNDGSYSQISDLRMKQSVLPLSNTLAGVMALRPSSFTYKDDNTGHRSIGFIAQEVKLNFPEMVTEIKRQEGGGLLAVDYSKAGVVAIKAIQEQQELIEQLQKEIAWLKQQMQMMNSTR